MKSPQQVWEEAYPDRRKWEALDQDTRDECGRVVRIAQKEDAFGNHVDFIAPHFLYRDALERKIASEKKQP